MATPENLIQELTEASRTYYQDLGESPLTDEEFDRKLEELEGYSNSHPSLFAPGTPGYLLLEGAPALGTNPTGKAIVTHSHPMLSLGKAKNEDELSTYLTKAKAAGAQDFVIQAKLDGLALSVVYQEGRLRHIATRGNGLVGDDTTYLATAPQVTVLGLPPTITTPGKVEVRGEIYLTHAQFATVNKLKLQDTGESFKNPRNATTGLMKKAKLGVSFPVEFSFTTYTYYQDDHLRDLSTAPQEFITVEAVTAGQTQGKLTGFTTLEEVFEAVEAFGVARKTFTLPTDGAVVKPTNEAAMASRMGATSHHPNSQVAYKYPGGVEETTVRGWTITVGKTGKLTPTAMTDPVDLAGSTLSNFSCHNYNWVHHRGVRVGSRVVVTKKNDIIPQITAVLENPSDSIPLTVPTHCPSCSTLLLGTPEVNGPPKTLTCPNLECPSRDYFSLKTAVMKAYLNIDRLGESTLSALHEQGRVTTIADLYTLTQEELSTAPNGTAASGEVKRLGEKTAQHILKHIEASKDLPLPRLLAALGIPLLGLSTAKSILKALPTLDDLQAATPEELEAIDGMGAVKAATLHQGLRQKATLISKLQEAGVKFTPQEVKQGKLTGLSFAISGEVPPPFANRNAWVSYLEGQGGSFHAAPKQGTSFMVGDPSAKSAKTQKAHKLSIPFLTPQEFTDLYG